MLKTKYLLFMILVPLTLAFPSLAYADQSFHTSRLNFALTTAGSAAGNPQLIAGQVVDIHANGPKIGAIERYMINGAKPNTAYQVTLRIFSKNCAGSFLFPIPTALLTTNNHGFAQGGHVFTPTDLAPFKGTTAGVVWTLVSDGVVAYDTSCIFVTID